MKEYEKLLKAFANKRRLEIVKYIKDRKEATVGNIASHIKLSYKATSKHLRILCATDVVEMDQRSTMVFYRLSTNLHELAKRIIYLL